MKKKWWAASLAVAMVITSVPAIPAAVYAAEPMLIEAEDYSSYSGKLKVMTNNKNASGGKYVGDFDNLDCLSYKIQIEKAGNYQITLTVGTIQDGGIALLNCGGNVSEKISIPNTKNWNTYRDVTATLWLDEGEQVLTVSNMGATWNIDKLMLIRKRLQTSSRVIRKYIWRIAGKARESQSRMVRLPMQIPEQKRMIQRHLCGI